MLQSRARSKCDTAERERYLQLLAAMHLLSHEFERAALAFYDDFLALEATLSDLQLTEFRDSQTTEYTASPAEIHILRAQEASLLNLLNSLTLFTQSNPHLFPPSLSQSNREHGYFLYRHALQPRSSAALSTRLQDSGRSGDAAGEQTVEIVTFEQIEREYFLVSSKLCLFTQTDLHLPSRMFLFYCSDYSENLNSQIETV